MAVSPLPAANTAFLAIVKKSFVPMVNANDQSLILNVGALRLGLEALLKEDASDFVRADQLWSRAIRLLQVEEANDVGASAEGVVQMDDTFAMGAFANELDYGGWEGWP